MLKIDIHTHILPENWPDLREKYGYGGFVSLEHHKCGGARMLVDGKFFREVEANCWDPAVRIQEFQQHQVDVQVLSTVPIMFSYWAKPADAHDLSRFLNDHIAGVVAQYPKRFVGLGTIPMQAPELAVKELERCVRELGLAGVQVGTHVNDWNLDQDELFVVFEAARDIGAAVFVHPWDMLGKERMLRYWLPWLVGMPAETSVAICSLIFGGVLERLPGLRIGFAHGGGAFPASIGRIEQGFNMRRDLCAVDNDVNPRAYLDRIYLDTVVHEPLMLEYLLRLMGPQRLALGSDYPFPLGELEPGKLIETTVSDEHVRARLLHGTALEWLNLGKEQFV